MRKDQPLGVRQSSFGLALWEGESDGQYLKQPFRAERPWSRISTAPGTNRTGQLHWEYIQLGQAHLAFGGLLSLPKQIWIGNARNTTHSGQRELGARMH